jgi:anti-sigma B factor antagonist
LSTTFFIKTQEIGTVRILELFGKLIIGANCREFRAAFDAHLEAGASHILINCGQVSFMDSSGIGELIGCQTRAAQAGRKLALCDIPKKVKDLFRITNVYKLFTIYETEDAAVEVFTKELEALLQTLKEEG